MADREKNRGKGTKRKIGSSTCTSITSTIKKLKKGPFTLLKRSSERKITDSEIKTDDVSRLEDGFASLRGEETVNPDEDDLLDDGKLPSDTMVAIQIMLQEFPKVEKSVAKPFVLRSQLYSSVADRTMVDRQLEELKQEKKVRVFKMSTAKDDYAIMLIEDYLQQVATAHKEMGNKSSRKKTTENLEIVFYWFRKHVLPVYLSAGITHTELVYLLASGGGKVEDNHISLLIQGGLLVRQLTDGTAYWFSMPNVGSILKSLVQGRKEVLGLLSRKKFGEALQSQFTNRKLRFSKLGIRFHMRDLQGLGLVDVIPTTAGPLLRLTSR